MRLRRVMVRGDFGKIELDLRGSEGSVLDLCGVIGGNGAGKSLITGLVARAWLSGWAGYSEREISEHPYRGVDSEVEFDIGNGISTAVIKGGKVVQSLPKLGTVITEKLIDNGLLAYGSQIRLNVACTKLEAHSLAISLVLQPLRDFYKFEVRNSIVVLDDWDMGLDDFCAREFLQLLVRKSLERNNQLIVMGRRMDGVMSLGTLNIRNLPLSVNVVDEAMKVIGKV